LGVTASIGTVGDSFDNAMAEAMFALFKTELFRNPAVLSRIGGHWKGLDDLEIETTKWVSLIRTGNCGGSRPWKRMEHGKQFIAEAIPR
jgi:transposase InsO family protein